MIRAKRNIKNNTLIRNILVGLVVVLFLVVVSSFYRGAQVYQNMESYYQQGR